MKKLLYTPAIILALAAMAVVPAGATSSLVTSFATTAVHAAAHAKSPHYVTNVDLRADAPAAGSQAVSVVYLLGAFLNPRIAGFVVATQSTTAQCELFPAVIGATPRLVACPAKGIPVPSWAPRITAASLTALVDARAYALSPSPSLATLSAAAGTKGLLPVGYKVRVARGTNPNSGAPAIRFTVSKGTSSVNVCVTGPTPPRHQLSYISTYGLAPC
jgi:hypothetical protein